MTHQSFVTLIPGNVTVGMFDRHSFNAQVSPSSTWIEDTYSDIFKAQSDVSTEFAKMLSSAQQSLNKPFLEEQSY